MKDWRTRLAGAMLLTAALSHPAWADTTGPTSLDDVMKSEERAQRDLVQQRLASLSNEPKGLKNHLATATLDFLLPGAGEVYLTADPGRVVSRTLGVAAVDALVGSVILAAVPPGTTGDFGQRAAMQAVPLGIGIGLTHFVFGGLVGVLAAEAHNGRMRQEHEGVKAEARQYLARFEAVGRERMAKAARRLDLMEQARGHAAEQRFETALATLTEVEADTEVNALKQTIQTQWEAAGSKRDTAVAQAPERDSEAELDAKRRAAEEAEHRKLRNLVRDAGALADKEKYYEAAALLFPYADESQVKFDFQSIDSGASRDFYFDMLNAIGKSSPAACQQRLAAIQKRLGTAKQRISWWLVTSPFNGQFHEAKVGSPFIASGKVLAVGNGGLLVNFGERPVFLRTPKSLGVVDGDSLTVGAVLGAPYTYNDGGRRVTVRSATFKINLTKL